MALGVPERTVCDSCCEVTGDYFSVLINPIIEEQMFVIHLVLNNYTSCLSHVGKDTNIRHNEGINV